MNVVPDRGRKGGPWEVAAFLMVQKGRDMSKKILLVDDDQDFRDLIQTQLECLGMTALPAASAAEAQAMLKTTQPDAAIVDLMMEEVDSGFVLCYWIKKLYPSTPVIMVSGVHSETRHRFDATTEEERAWLKADVMLDKPIRFETLRKELERLLTRSQVTSKP